MATAVRDRAHGDQPSAPPQHGSVVETTGPLLSISHLTKTYPGATAPAMDDVSFDVSDGEFVSLLGPSGCGKTTTLKTIAGLEHPDAGSIRLGDWALSTQDTWTPVHKRPFGMVFQSYALWPHMTVAQNVGYPLKARRVPKSEIRERVMRALARVQMGEFADRSPSTLSGGQQQRVSIARAIVHEPRILLLDEPLSNLDAALRRQMRLDLRHLQQELGITAVYVTHDQVEACALSDRVIVMQAGRIVGDGAPQEVYEQPPTEFIAGFMGAATFWDGRLVRASDGLAEVDVLGERGSVGRLRSGGWSEQVSVGDACRVLVRPEHVQLQVSLVQAVPGDPGPVGALPGRVVTRTFLGEQWEIDVDLGGATIRVHGALAPEVGTPVRVSIAPQHVRLLPVTAGASSGEGVAPTPAEHGSAFQQVLLGD